MIEKTTIIKLPGKYIPEVAGKEVTVTGELIDGLMVLLKMSVDNKEESLTMSYMISEEEYKAQKDTTISLLEHHLENVAFKLLYEGEDYDSSKE